MLNNLTLFSAASARMEYDKKRHNLLASNIANANTPGYIGKDLSEFSLDNSKTLLPNATRDTHLNYNQSVNPYSKMTQTLSEQSFEETINHNKISIEDEMAKASEAQSNYAFSSAVWKKSMDLFMSVVRPR